jgi:hypothetical protein
MRRLLLLALTGIGFLLVLLIAVIVLTRQTTTTPSSTLIKRITFGTLRKADEANQTNPRLKSQDSYEAGQPLGLSITTIDPVSTSFTVRVRLLTKLGQVRTLTPAQFTITPTKSTYCCWTITEPGDYSLQIFLPQQGLTAISFKIQPRLQR